jgi:putative ABC transport system permease protein
MSLRTETRHALRSLIRSPRYALTAILMLALGIGLSVASYSVLHGLLLGSLPLHDGAAIRVLEARNPAEGIEGAQFTTEEAETLAEGVAGFQRIAYYLWYSVGVYDGERARNLTAHVVGPGYFEALGVTPALGRLIRDDDIREGRAVALLSHAEWQRSFGGSPAVIGQRLELIDDAPLEVIGVLPPGIAVFSGDAELWRPLPPDRLWQGETRRTLRTLMLVGRVQPGTSTAAAEAALAARLAALPRGEGRDGWQARTQSLLDQLLGDVRAALWGALALALLVLLIGATNLALMQAARRAAHQRDEAMLQALGATPARLRRARILELALLSAAATALGAALAVALVAGSRQWLISSLPRADEVHVDLGALGFAIALGLLIPAVGLLLGARRGRCAQAGTLRAAAGLGPLAAPRWLPGVAVALATVSVVAALALGDGLRRLQQVDPGYRAESVQVLQIFRVGTEAFVPFAEGLIETLAALPGVEQVALTSAVPLSDIGSAAVDLRRNEQDPGALQQAGMRKVSAGYRELLDIPLIAGRDFDARDRRGAPDVVLLSEAAARRLFPGQSPIGRTIERSLGRGDWTEHTVVGVIGDIRNRGPRAEPTPEILVPFAQSPRVGMAFLIRGQGAGLEAAIREALHRVDPRQPITAQYALSDALAEQLKPAQLFASAAGVYSLLALLLAALGLYALAALEQRRRLPEYGLRAAIGARPGQLAALALRDSARVSAAGALLGAIVVAAAFHSTDLQALGIAPGAPVPALLAGSLVMALISVLASYLPARRAARVDPMAVLREG